MNNTVRNLLAVLVVTLIATHASFATGCPSFNPHCDLAPEIDPAMGVGALALIGGAIMVIRGRSRAKK